MHDKLQPTELLDDEIFYPMPAESETVLVSFGARGGGRGVFHFAKQLRPLPGFTKLLVRDPAGHWYNDGLPGVGDTVEEIAHRIKSEVRLLGGKRIITLGPSMGAYAAILFGCLLDAERAIALGPQTLLDRGLHHSPPPKVRLQVPDLRPIVRDAPNTKVDLVAGWDDHADIFNAQRIADLPSVRVLALQAGVHTFPSDLHRTGRLIPLLTDLVEGRVPAQCEVDPQIEPDVEQGISDTAFAVQRQDWPTVKRRIGPVAERYPNWAGPNFDLGMALEGLGDAEGAEAAYERAVRANPAWIKARKHLVEILSRQGRPTDIEGFARGGLALEPRWAYGHLCLARCLSQLGRADEATNSARRAAELDPKLLREAEALVG